MIRNRLLAEERRLARAKSRAEELAKMQRESEMRESDTEVETEPQNTANIKPLGLVIPSVITCERRTENDNFIEISE